MKLAAAAAPLRSSPAPPAAAVTGCRAPAPVGSGPVVAREAAVRAQGRAAPVSVQVVTVPAPVSEARAPVVRVRARRSRLIAAIGCK